MDCLEDPWVGRKEWGGKAGPFTSQLLERIMADTECVWASFGSPCNTRPLRMGAAAEWGAAHRCVPLQKRGVDR